MMTQETEEPRTRCIRCGECCLASSPTLQIADLPLVQGGFIKRGDLFTIRAGEPVWDNIRRKMGAAGTEMIKVRERSSQGCTYYEDAQKRCVIYEHRPSQCAALACWDINEYMKVFNTPKAARTDLIGDGVIRGLMAEHEKRCGYALMEDRVKRIQEAGEEAVVEILEMLKFDHHLRPFAAEKLGIPLAETDLLFGRPLTDTLNMFGLKVIREPDGSFLLTKM